MKFDDFWQMDSLYNLHHICYGEHFYYPQKFSI